MKREYQGIVDSPSTSTGMTAIRNGVADHLLDDYEYVLLIGARSVLCTLRDHGEQFRAGVGLHPSFCTTDDSDSPHLAVPSYTGSLYIGFGSADPMQPASANTALIEATKAFAKGEAEIHDGADHRFGVYGPGYHEKEQRTHLPAGTAKVTFDRELTG